MLRRKIQLIQGTDNAHELEVKFQEIVHYQQNFGLMATVSALFAGFEFTIFSIETSAVGEYGELHASSLVYVLCAVASLCVNARRAASGRGAGSRRRDASGRGGGVATRRCRQRWRSLATAAAPAPAFAMAGRRRYRAGLRRLRVGARGDAGARPRAPRPGGQRRARAPRHAAVLRPALGALPPRLL